MPTFDPVRQIAKSELVLDTDGQWPNFHDAEVHSLSFWRGDLRPDDNVWIGPVIEATLELTALIEPFIAVLRFHECDAIDMKGFNHSNSIYAMNFGLEDRGHLKDGVTPLLPYITVEFQQAFGVALRFKCFKVEAVERREVDPSRYT
jgi:hypothetical protein